MALLSAQSLTMAFGGRPLLEDATLQVEGGERVGLLGRNGEGKSTLLKILAGRTPPDDGEVVRASGTRVALLEQQVPVTLPGSVDDVILSGRPGHAARHDHHVQRLASLLELDGAAPFDTLSGGQKRRALLGRALAAEPDVLLLDEPTNHLDLESIEWLEGFLRRFEGTLVFVTHDRAFLQALATRIVELDRGRLTSWACDYATYLERKEEQLASEEKAWELQDRKLAAEEAWIRQGIKARRTRNEGRVRALERLRADRAERRERVGSVRMTLQEADRSGKRVIVAEHVDFGWLGEHGELLVQDFSATILRGDKVGIIGPNGAGKTTLVNLLLGRLEPTAGAVKHGTALEVAYFDQHREQLDPSASVAEAVADGADHVVIAGERRHVHGYLQDFLFPPERARQPVGSLSGGERNRLLLARLFTRPANVLVLDEPTNDLDMDTLELLESLLVGFAGTVLAVSHDRRFLDNLCTTTLVFEGGGRVKEYAGGYTDWKRAVARREAEARSGSEEAKVEAPPRGKGGKPGRGSSGASPGGAGKAGARPGKLSWKEERELEALPGTIEALEAELAELHRAMADPDFYKGEADAIKAAVDRVAAIEADIEGAFERWAELGERRERA